MKKRTVYVANSDEFEKAFEELDSGGTVVLSGSITAKHTRLAKHGGVITITGEKLVFAESATITLGGETVFENITIDVATSGVIAANFNHLTFGEGVTVNCDLTEEGNGLYIIGGENNCANEKEAYVDDTDITLKSGTFSRVVGFSRGCINRAHTGHAALNIGGNAYVRYVVAGAMGNGATAGSASLSLHENAVIEAIHMGGGKEENTLSGDMDIFVDGGDIYRFDKVGLSAVLGKRSLVYNPKTAPDGLLYLAELALFDSIKSTCDIDGHVFGEPFDNPFGGKLKAHTCTVCGYTEPVEKEPQAIADNVIFVCDGGFGNGMSPHFPLGSYADALAKLTNGGTVVINGKCTLSANLIDQFEKVTDAYQEPRHSENITVTSLYGGVDYRENGACLYFEKDIDYRMSGPLTFENIIFVASEKAKCNRIIARYNPLIIGEDCKTPTRDNYSLDIIGGYLQFRYTDFDGAVIENEYENLVSICRRLPLGYKIDNLEPIKRYPRCSLRSEAADAFNRMFDDMEKEGLKVPTVTDAMRTYAKQYALFTGYLGRLRRTFGYTFEEARRVVMRSCAVPCSSEHQWGVAVDMYHLDMTEYGTKKHHYFDITPEWAWVHENGKKYGIVLRYPADKTDLTGCIYEAWHFRYVGRYHAVKMNEKGMCLEEYVEYLKTVKQ